MPHYADLTSIAQNETDKAVLLPGDSIALLFSVLGEYAGETFNWYGSADFGFLTVEETDVVKALVAKTERALMEEITMAEGTPLGGIIPYTGDVPPENWVFCDGSNLMQSEYPELTAVIGDEFKDTINGVGIIRVPAIGGRFIMGVQPGTHDVLETGGAETHTLTIAEMPAHTHGIPTALAASTGAQRRVISGGADTTQTMSEGGGGSHNNLPPFIVLPYIMRVA